MAQSVDAWLLPALVLVPLAGAVAAAVPGAARRRSAALVAAAVPPALVALIALRLDVHRAGRLQLVVDRPWIDAAGVRLHLGVDGLSLWLLAATVVLGLAAVWLTAGRPPAGAGAARGAAFVLAGEAAAIGALLAQDAVLFFCADVAALGAAYLALGRCGAGRAPRLARRWGRTGAVAGGALLLTIAALGALSTSGSFQLPVLAAAGGSGLSRVSQDLAFAGLLIAFGSLLVVPLVALPRADALTPRPFASGLQAVSVELVAGAGLLRFTPCVPRGASDWAPLVALAAAGLALRAAVVAARRAPGSQLRALGAALGCAVLVGVAARTADGLTAAAFALVALGLVAAAAGVAVVGAGGSPPTWEAAAGRVAAALALAALPGLATAWGLYPSVGAAWHPGVVSSRPLVRLAAAAAALAVLAVAATGLRGVGGLAAEPAAGAGPGSGPPGLPPSPASRVAALATWGVAAVLLVATGSFPGIVTAVVEPVARRAVGG